MASKQEAPRLAVVGIGSMVADRMHRVRKLLGAEEKTVMHTFADGSAQQVRIGGVMLNQMGWAAALGLPVGIFGKQADDADGRLLRAAMDRLGIERHIVLDGSASSFAPIFVDDSGERSIYMAPGATSETTAEHVRDHHADFIAGAASLSTEISQLPLAAAREAMQIARAAGARTVLDFDVPPSEAVPGLGDAATLEEVLGLADLLKPAKAAARELVPDAGDDTLAVAQALRSRTGAEAVVVTAGEDGCAVATEGLSVRVPACTPKEVVDTTGAGDAFLGGLQVGLAAGLGWEDAARLGNACGAACVEKLGAFPDDPAAARARVAELYDGPPVASLAAASDADASDAAASADPGRAALTSLDVALEELAALRARLDADAFARAVALVQAVESAAGRVHVTGVGKPEHVAHYAASVLSSTGTPATFLHATEAVHGSAGQVVPGDLVVAISNSGGTAELLHTVEAVRALGARVLAVTGDPVRSPLAAACDAALDAGVAREGGGLGFAPRASVAAEVLVLAALSAALEEARGFTRDDYHARHPSGALGQKSS